MHVLTRRHKYLLDNKRVDLTPYEEINGIAVHRLPCPPPKPLASIAYTLAAQPLLRRLKPDILHTHGIHSTGNTALAYRRKVDLVGSRNSCGFPIVVSEESAELSPTSERALPSGGLARKCDVYPLASFTAFVRAGKYSKRSPTTPTSATPKMGASASLLIATM